MLWTYPELRARSIFRPKVAQLLKPWYTFIGWGKMEKCHSTPELAWTTIIVQKICYSLLYLALRVPRRHFKTRNLCGNSMLQIKKFEFEFQKFGFDFMNFGKSSILPEFDFINYIHKIQFFCPNFISQNSSIWFQLLNRVLGIALINIILLNTTILHDLMQGNLSFFLDIC